MGWTWSPEGGVNIVIAVTVAAMAFLVYRSRPSARLNRMMALFLTMLTTMNTASGLAQFQTAAAHAHAWSSALWVLNVGALVTYWFLLASVPGTGVGFLWRPAPFSIMIGSGMILGWWSVETFTIFPLDTGWRSISVPLVQAAFILSQLAGVALLVRAWRVSPRTTMARVRARLLAYAMGSFLLVVAATNVAVSLLPELAADWTIVLWYAVGYLLLALLSAYGIVKHQLFDIDLKIKWTINRGTLVGLFLAVFFVVGVIAENFLTDRFGLAIGGVAAGFLLFALNPLQRFAERVSEAALPDVRDDEEYRLVRRRAVYQAAYESALLDGAVSEKERDVLATLADELGLSAGDARKIERLLAVPGEV